MIAIVDYGVGNLFSLCCSLDAIGAKTVVTSDPDVIRSADYIIDMGPEGGEDGGRIVACGTPDEIRACGESVTGRFL